MEADFTMEVVELAETREHLLQLRAEVLAESERAYAASQSLGKDGVPDIGDMSSNSYHQEVLMNLSETQRSRVRDIDAAIERMDKGRWVLLDYGEIMVHVFQQPVREFYDLEGLWSEAPEVELVQTADQ